VTGVVQLSDSSAIGESSLKIYEVLWKERFVEKIAFGNEERWPCQYRLAI
jgi:hypothetical protein